MRPLQPAVVLAVQSTFHQAATLFHEDHGDLSPSTRLAIAASSVVLVLVAGLMSGLTLGLMSMDVVELEVLKRSGTTREQRYAGAIMPLVSNQHFLLVTLLLCNACAMEALPLFLDRLADPVTAIIISVTAVLLFGEIIPQAVCSRYGLAIGYYSSWLVRALMVLTCPITWPIGKLLDFLLGADHRALFRRGQLKALVDLHGADEGLGGNLTEDEIKVICGALDLTSKTARKSMTPLDKAFMLSSEERLTRDTLKQVLASGHSRIPVYQAPDRTNIVGLILVKELLQYRAADEVQVTSVRMRSLPRLPADTPMYDMLKLFQTGRSHMVVLTDTPEAARKQAELQAALLREQEERHARGLNGGAWLASTGSTPVSSPLVAGAEQVQRPFGQPPGFECSRNGSATGRREAGEVNGDSLAGRHPRLSAIRDSDVELTDSPRAFEAAQQQQQQQEDPLSPRHQQQQEEQGLLSRSMSKRRAFTRTDSGPRPWPTIMPTDVPVPIGIITIEDVIEELMQAEIIDETDQFIDNERSVVVNAAVLAQSLPAQLRSALAANPGVLPSVSQQGGGGAAAVAVAAAAAVQGARMAVKKIKKSTRDDVSGTEPLLSSEQRIGGSSSPLPKH